MATYRVPIIGHHTLPDTSGSVFFEPFPVKASNDRWKLGCWIFNDTSTRLELYSGFTVPKNYVGTAKVIIVWTTSATTGNAVWDFDYRAVGGNDAESLDQTTQDETVTVTDAAPGAAYRRLETSITLTAGNFAADDTVEYLIARDGADGSETLAAAAILWDVYFEYADA